MKKLFFIALSLFLVTAFVTANMADARGMRDRGGSGSLCGGMGNMAMIERLNLTPEQTAKVAELKKEQFKQTAPLREKMFSKRNELKLLWLETTPSQEKIAAAQKEMRNLRDQMQDKMTAFRLELVKMLTPEQRARIHARGVGPGSRWSECCPPGGGSGPGPGPRSGKGGRLMSKI